MKGEYQNMAILLIAVFDIDEVVDLVKKGQKPKLLEWIQGRCRKPGLIILRAQLRAAAVDHFSNFSDLFDEIDNTNRGGFECLYRKAKDCVEYFLEETVIRAVKKSELWPETFEEQIQIVKEVILKLNSENRDIHKWPKWGQCTEVEEHPMVNYDLSANDDDDGWDVDDQEVILESLAISKNSSSSGKSLGSSSGGPTLFGTKNLKTTATSTITSADSRTLKSKTAPTGDDLQEDCSKKPKLDHNVKAKSSTVTTSKAVAIRAQATPAPAPKAKPMTKTFVFPEGEKRYPSKQMTTMTVTDLAAHKRIVHMRMRNENDLAMSLELKNKLFNSYADIHETDDQSVCIDPISFNRKLLQTLVGGDGIEKTVCKTCGFTTTNKWQAIAHTDNHFVSVTCNRPRVDKQSCKDVYHKTRPFLFHLLEAHVSEEELEAMKRMTTGVQVVQVRPPPKDKPQNKQWRH